MFICLHVSDSPPDCLLSAQFVFLDFTVAVLQEFRSCLIAPPPPPPPRVFSLHKLPTKEGCFGLIDPGGLTKPPHQSHQAFSFRQFWLQTFECGVFLWSTSTFLVYSVLTRKTTLTELCRQRSGLKSHIKSGKSCPSCTPAHCTTHETLIWISRLQK